MRRVLSIAFSALVLVACAADSKTAAKEPSSMRTTPSPAGTSAYAAPPPDLLVTPATPSMGPIPGGAPPPRATVAAAASDLESSQRELDVAAGDCRNACRALGSMDRAAGRLCELAQDSEARRCDDAKQRVYSARDRVKNTCGSCPNGPSVDRKDPVPSKGSASPP
jgi:hypothetical protein